MVWVDIMAWIDIMTWTYIMAWTDIMTWADSMAWVAMFLVVPYEACCLHPAPPVLADWGP